jgi:uncharacterized LabA/DUF88 family protein
MALLYNDHPDAFGIVSSDADFTPLVMHLREKGAAVYGFGDTKTPEPFRTACTKFLFLDQLAGPDEDGAEAPSEAAAESATESATESAIESPKAASEPAAGTRSTTRTRATTSPAATSKAEPRPARKTTAELRQDAGLVRLLRNAAQRAAEEDGWARVSAMGQQIANQSSFDSRNHGYASLTKLLTATQLFDLRDEGKPSMAVRDKRAATKGG